MAVVGRICPPDDGEEDGPRSGEYVVGEKSVSEIERVFGILLGRTLPTSVDASGRNGEKSDLPDSPQPPHKSKKSDD